MEFIRHSTFDSALQSPKGSTVNSKSQNPESNVALCMLVSRSDRDLVVALG